MQIKFAIQIFSLGLVFSGCGNSDAWRANDAEPTADVRGLVTDAADSSADVATQLPAVQTADPLPFETVVAIGDAPGLLAGYSCAGSPDGNGPEAVYRVDASEAGLLAIEVDSSAAHVYLLSAPDPSQCVVDGPARTARWVEPGSYWVAVEGSPSSSLTLRIALTTPTLMAGHGMNAEVARNGLRAFSFAWRHGDTQRLLYGMIDFSLNSRMRREWIVDLARSSLLHQLFVAHGAGSSDPSDSSVAATFSNIDGSHQSSLGMVRTAETYEGTYGHSCRIDGLEPGYNDAVRSRVIVVHPWEYSRAEWVAANGETGPTWGCPAIDDRVAPQIVDEIAGGTLLWFWYPDGDWSVRSTYLQ